ncbi:FixH family protein [Saccharomonospora sp. NPDC006951]
MNLRERIPRGRLALTAAAVVVALGALLLMWPRLSEPDHAVVRSAGTERYHVQLTVEHTNTAPGDWLLEIDSGSGPAAADRVLVEPAMPSMGHALTPSTATAEGEGRYRVRDAALPMAGQWEVVVTITEDGIEDRVVFPLLVTG